MTETLESFEVGPLTVRIVPDYDAESPRTAYDNLGIMVCAHRRYELGDEQLDTSAVDDYHDGDLTAYLVAEHDALPESILPLYLLDHSGLAMSTGDFGDPWDSGQVGVIFTTAAKVEQMGTAPEHVADALRGEVAEYDLWLQGGYVAFVVENAAGDVLDSCWGFDDPEYAKDEGRDAAEAEPAYRRWTLATSAQLEGVGL